MTKPVLSKADQKLIKALNLHRTIKGSSQAAADLMMAMVKAAGVEFVKLEGKRFLVLKSGVIDLLENNLASLENLIYQKAVDIADANTTAKMAPTKIKKLLTERVGPAGTVDDMLKASTSNIVRRVSNEMSRLNAEGYLRSDIRQAIIGTAQAGYEDGILGSAIRGSEALMRTAAVMADETAQDAERRQDKKAVGYVWVSVLDGGTTLTCADLNGREFFYADSGYQPLPPQHIGCRSTTETIYDGEDVPKVTSVYEFIKNNPDEARDMLGATRYQLVTDGKLRIDRFTDRHFSPLTVEQLREKNAVAFKRIGR